VFVLTMLWALRSNRDVFSPAKFFLFSVFIFHLGALAGPSSYQLWMLVLLVVLVGATVVLFEAVSPLPQRPRYPLELRRYADPPNFLLWIWALSLPALTGELYVLWHFGGLQAYVNILYNRVVEFRGLGFALTLSGTLVAWNLAYFVIGLTRPRSRRWWSLYAIHFVMTLLVGLLSGSRGATLNVIAIQLFCYHYIRGNVRLRTALTVAVALLGFALAIGAVRNAVRIGDQGVTTGWNADSQAQQYGAFQYGTQPLQILLDADRMKLAYGVTLASAVTNLVPRSWWPDKPDTGGVFFTKEYTGNAWGGASNLTPTLLGEFVINFGWVAGIALYVLVYPTLLYLLVRYYRRVIPWARVEGGAAGAIEILIYLCVMWALVGLMIAEVTSTLQNLITTKVLPLLLLKAVFGMRLWPLRPRRFGAASAAQLPPVTPAG
jgi:hypothetical protein